MRTNPNKIFINAIKKTCGACPSVYEAETEIGTIIFYYRHGHLIVGGVPNYIVEDWFGNIGSGDGVMGYDDLKQIMNNKFDFPEELEPEEF